MEFIPYIHATDAVTWFVDDLSARVVAQSGIPSDRHHLGKLILESLRESPDFLLQIDGATDQSERSKSVLKRSIQCAVALTKLGLKKGDIMILIGHNHLDLAIPHYAALYLGVIIYNIDLDTKEDILAKVFASIQPKMIFCDNVKLQKVMTAIEACNDEIVLVTFGDNDEHVLTFFALMNNDVEDAAIDNFKSSDFDSADAIALITETSGTTGVPKGAAFTHRNLCMAIALSWMGFDTFPEPLKSTLIITPLNWITSMFQFLYSPILRYTRIQTSKPTTTEHLCELISKYKPSYLFTTTPSILSLLEYKNVCDLNSFKIIRLGGCYVPTKILEYVRTTLPDVHVNNGYGLSEVSGFVFNWRSPPIESLGQPIGNFSYRLIDIETGMDIVEPNKQGELWLKGPTIFKEYYKDPEATRESFSEDGWFKTGDIMYRDEHFNFYYVDRLKLLINYENYKISPQQIEKVIQQHPGVKSVVVLGVTDVERNELPCACVVRKDGYEITEQEIKDLVKVSLSDPKQLRGGVIFLEEMPVTPRLKIDKRKIKELVFNSIKDKSCGY